MKRDILLPTKLIPISQIFDYKHLANIEKDNTDLKPATKIGNSYLIKPDAAEFRRTTISVNHASLPTNTHNYQNSIIIDQDKLYNCPTAIQLKGVRSVVRISRRSSEPSKETVSLMVNTFKPKEITLNRQSNEEKTTSLSIDWEGYKEYLSNLNKSKKEIQNKLGYGKTYSYILKTGNAQDLMKVSNGCRVHAMRALSTLSKYAGCYEQWMKIVKKYQLRWKNENYSSLNTFKSIFGIEEGSEHTLSRMMEWIKSSMQALPDEVGKIILFNTLIGLRPAEAQKAIFLIKTKGTEYVNKEKGLLLHYLYPKNFLRTTKKCYISIINKSILDLVQSIKLRDSYYYTVRSAFDRKGIKINMYYCRKVFATYLRNKGIEPEIIDLLQGRISSSVFVNHYYRPDINEIITKRIRPVLEELRKELLN